MDAIYSNFDGLDISFQCALPEHILNALCDAKKKAQETKSDAIIKIGKSEKIILVGETGSRGGFTYRFDTGFDGETWFVVHSLKRDSWNVRVSIKSLCLALYAYKGAKEKIMDFLISDLGAVGISRLYKSNIIETPLERVSRVDYCIDFKTDYFVPDISAFIGKGRFKKRVLSVDENSKDTYEIIFSGRAPKYFRIGSMPNRQVVLYDKISDVTEKKKNYWWNIWGIKKSEFKGQIWRVEVRAGKKELNKWNLRNFDDFDKRIGDVISGILKAIKYTIPSNTDLNITRWPMAGFWIKAISISEEKLQNNISMATRKMIIEGYRNEISNQFEKSILGQAVSYAALHDMDISEIPTVLDVLGDSLIERIRKNPKKFEEKHQNATDKYSNLKG